ncbi:MAG: hypothetical protein ACYC2H_07265 [Thermoplasmatota archaeon]
MVRSVSNSIGRVSSVFTRLDLTQIGLQQSHERVRVAQERLTLATNEGGAASVAAIKARRDLEAAERDLEKTQLRARLSTVLIVGDIASMAAGIPAAVRSLAALRAAQLATAGSASAMNIAMTGGIAAIGIVAGLAVVAATMSKVDSGSSAAADSVAGLEAQLKSLVAERNRLANQPEPATHGYYLNPDFDITGEKLRGLDEQIRTTTETLNVFKEQAVKEAGEATKKAAEEAERAWLQANVSLQNSLVGGLGQVGASLQKLSLDAQKGILIGGGLDPKFVETLMSAQLAEDRLTASALRSSRALRDQTTITARKSETSEEFNARLIELGFTEEELRARVDETGLALQRQTDATLGSSAAASSAIARLSNAVNGSSSLSGNPLAALIGLHQDKFLQGLYGEGASVSRWGMQFDVGGIARVLQSGESGIGQVGVGAYTGAAGSETRQKALSTLENIIVENTSSSQWDVLLRSIGTMNLGARADLAPARPVERSVIIEKGAIVVSGRQGDELLRNLQRLGVKG